MKRIQRNSISFRLFTLLIIVFILLISLVVVNNAIAIKDIQNNAYRTMKDTLTMYNNRLDDNFNKVEKYLVSFAYNDLDIQILDTKDVSSSQWFSSLYRIQKSLSAAIPIYGMSGFFLYSLPGDTLIAETESSVSFKTLQAIKDTIRPLMKDNSIIDKNHKNNWMPIQIEGQYYLFKVLRIHSSYIGAWISADAALSPLVGNGLNEYIFLVDHNGILLNKNTPIESISTDLVSHHNSYQILEVNKKINLLVSVKMNVMDSYIVSLIPEAQFFVETHDYIIFLSIALILILCMMVFTVFITKRWVIQPLHHLLEAISSLRKGNLETVVNNKEVSAEFKDVYEAFNEMVSEIKTLKIDIYEEKLSRQNIQMQYLKLQIAPHFLINCISMVYQLSEIGKYDLSKIMLKDLSNHLRYTLSSGETVSLKQEMSHVENYIELSKIRYPNSINLYTDCVSDSLSATVIPLLIHNFVENTVKYEASIDRPIDIHIRTTLIKKDDKDYLSICIWDTGSGFNDKILGKLENIDEYVAKKHSEHIGLSNIIERASLVFGMNKCHFHFSNRMGAGAQINIELPYIPFSKEEQH